MAVIFGSIIGGDVLRATGVWVAAVGGVVGDADRFATVLRTGYRLFVVLVNLLELICVGRTFRGSGNRGGFIESISGAVFEYLATDCILGISTAYVALPLVTWMFKSACGMGLEYGGHQSFEICLYAALFSAFSWVLGFALYLHFRVPCTVRFACVVLVFFSFFYVFGQSGYPVVFLPAMDGPAASVVPTSRALRALILQLVTE